MNNTNQKLNRFSIRKYSVGVASVLVGIAFLGTPVLADQVSEANDATQETVLTTTPKDEVEQAVSASKVETNKVAEPAVEAPEHEETAVVSPVTEDTTVPETQPVASPETDEKLPATSEVPVPAEKTLPTKTVDPTNPEGKKTVGYAAANIDKPETSIVNDVTRVRATKKDGKLVTGDKVAESNTGYVALLATGDSGVIGDDYPTNWRNPSAADSWGYYQTYCTSFVAHRLHNINHFEIPRAIGNAGDWGANARALGYRVDNVPAVGSVAWSLPYTGWAGSVGHVSWVAAIKGDNVLVEEYNRLHPFAYDTYEMPISSISGFIHFKDLAGGATHSPSTSAPTPNQGTPASGVYHFTGRASIKAEPKMSSPELAYYDAGQSVNYDRKLEADGHEWISYLSFAGNRRYIPIRAISKPATPSTPARKLSGTIRVENKRTGEFDVVVSNVYSPNGVKEVKLPTWSNVNGQDDIIWYTATRQSDGTYRQHVKASDHKNSSGEYSIHLYYVQNDGKLQGVGGTTTNVQAGRPAPNIPSSGVYHFTGYAAIRPEPRMSSAELAHYDAGNTVNYDRVLTSEGHDWISYISFSGNRRYIAIN